MKKNGFEPFLCKSEKEAKSFDIEANSEQYPIYLFKTDTSGEKTYEEFYTENENFDINQYNSLGFINTKDISISFGEVKNDFDKVFDNPESTKEDVVTVLKKYVTNFKHIETGKHLDQKM